MILSYFGSITHQGWVSSEIRELLPVIEAEILTRVSSEIRVVRSAIGAPATGEKIIPKLFR